MLNNAYRTLTAAALLAFAQLALGADELPVSKDSITPGDGQNVSFKGNPLPLEGQAVQVGKPLPAAMVTASDMAAVNLADGKGKVRIISVVPSLDTKVCEQQTHILSEKNGGIDKDVQLVTVSMDLPFAQNRFAKEAKISNITFLSDYKTAEFGMNNGLLVKPLHLLSRAVIVTDKDNVVRYVQVVPELTSLPDMSKAVEVAKGLAEAK
ncbi:MAG: thiol peroxidase [Gammaproteobacteria bacterium]